MGFGIPLLGDRAAPRSTFADSILLVRVDRHRVQDRVTVPLGGAKSGSSGDQAGRPDPTIPRGCLECRNRVCLQGEPCPYLELPPLGNCLPDTLQILESTWDVAVEEERTICRLSEVVYFVKDKSLANNLIGAVYSRYYLTEI